MNFCESESVGTLTNLGFTDLFKNVGTLTSLGFADLFKNVGNSYKSKFYRSILKMWELLQV
ncbi:hypothetical protein LEP1GSC151_0736 [Leptospira interrogans serovar Grippotyphosa str. LT2186]|uniref:Uncharacterized protein n=1 Tax=Leptospira interrogans serovar Grippotyphosa str. LT2186 TaxID=1001599 RepID=M3I029_LEPIR|nr:hypothetical protein [Leptospira interrogans]EMG09267.1 hypothetical protein LEP1GSC151_0736 [Leptospira interrogans serovar Grippotyphosa str. LT2186]EMN80998.1 hypothetical protein LEP1GSC106_4989 [Leptospira interrogans serovar Grippotyphosa str. UI 12764]EMN85325.1 hypothetical protein LEP1GSC107_3756 [Leptospira interrogans serovar Grippotyphosa str. UI 12769]